MGAGKPRACLNSSLSPLPNWTRLPRFSLDERIQQPCLTCGCASSWPAHRSAVHLPALIPRRYTWFTCVFQERRLDFKTNGDSHLPGSVSGVPHPHVQKSSPHPCVWLQLADIPFFSAFCLIKEPFRAWHFLFVTLHICCKQTPSHPSF